METGSLAAAEWTRPVQVLDTAAYLCGGSCESWEETLMAWGHLLRGGAALAGRFAWRHRHDIMRFFDTYSRHRYRRSRQRHSYRKGFLRGQMSGYRRGSRAGYRARSYCVPREEGMGSPRGWYSRGRRRGY